MYLYIVSFTAFAACDSNLVFLVIRSYKLENMQSKKLSLMVIIRIKLYFTLILLATCFGSLYRNNLRAVA